MSQFRIEKYTPNGIYCGKSSIYYHISDKPKEDGYFSVFEIHEHEDCSLCFKSDTECFSFSVYCKNAGNDDYDTYWAEDEINLCLDCLSNTKERLEVHMKKLQKMNQKVQSLNADMGKKITCTMENNNVITGNLKRISEKKHKIFILREGNQKTTGIDLMEIKEIEVK
jgi:hypothetical protein